MYGRTLYVYTLYKLLLLLLSLTIVGCLKGRQIENITKGINTMLWH